MTELLAGMAFGFLGSAHCVGMCGPIVMALPIRTDSRSRLFVGRVLYHLGRVLTYAAIGAVIGLFGGKILLPVLQQNLSIVVGVTVLLSAIAPMLFKRVSVVGLLQPLYRFVTEGIGTLMHGRSLTGMLFLGLLNGLLPCGFVYLAIAGATVSATVLGGMLFMAGFGFGTVPAMLTVSLFPTVLSVNVRTKLSRILPVVTAVVGLLLIVRGLNLGIPYISPKFNAPTVEAAKPDCCKDE